MPVAVVAATTSTLWVDPGVRAVYHQFRQNSPAWRACSAQFKERFPDPEALLEDLFLAFYAPHPRLSPEADPSRHWQAAIIASLLIHPTFRSLHARTVRDPLLAALAAIRMAQCLQQEDESFLPGRGGSRRWFLRLGPVHAWWGRRHRRTHPLNLNPIGAHPAEGHRTWRLTRVLDRLTAALTLDEKVRAAWGTEAGSPSLYAFDDVWALVELARQIQHLEELTDTLLRLAGLATALPRRQRPGNAGRHRLLGITQGNDLECLIPEEVAKFADPSTEGLFLEAYEHRRLLLHRYAGVNQKQAGPVIACVDVSRSMNTPAALGRERFVWAKAVALTLLRVAHREGRDFLGICFSSPQELETFLIPAGSPDSRQALLFARCDFDGGTHFEAPLRQAIQHLRQRGARHGHIVFITDGEAPVSSQLVQEYRQAKPSLDYRFLPVFIDGFHPRLASMGDRAFQVTACDAGSWEQVVLKVTRSLTDAPVPAASVPAASPRFPCTPDGTR